MTDKNLLHYRTIYKELQDILPELQAGTSMDSDGGRAFTLALQYGTLGTLAFLVDSDVHLFRERHVRASEIILDLLERFDAGEPIDSSFASVLVYKHVLQALAAGNASLARTLVVRLGNRPEVEKKHDHPFDRAFGYALKEVMLGDEASAWTTFDKMTGTERHRGSQGYAMVIRAIRENDASMANRGLQHVVDNHGHQARFIKGDPGKDLCVWGVGLMNLALYRGMQVEVKSPLLPAALLVH